MKLLAQANNSVFGQIKPPPVIEEGYGVLGDGATGTGLTGFLSNVIILLTVVGGIWALFNLVMAGFALITADGDAKEMSKAGEKMTMTVVGLILMVGAPLIAALLGLFVFGDATMLLQPTIQGPQVGP
jgi:uncharacterized membrane protein